MSFCGNIVSNDLQNRKYFFQVINVNVNKMVNKNHNRVMNKNMI